MPTLTENTIIPHLLRILKELNKPVDSVALARLVGFSDSSSIYRLMMKHPNVVHIHSHGLTTFTYREVK